jgi:hypothetical protein
VREQSREDGDERRSERSRGDELEDQIRDPKRGEERVQIARRPERRADDDDTNPAEDPRQQVGAGDDQAGPGKRQRGSARSWR